MTNTPREIELRENCTAYVNKVFNSTSLEYSDHQALDDLFTLVTHHTDAVIEEARSKDPHVCEFGHEVFSHNTAEGWCCACDADQAFMEKEIEERVEQLKEGK
jgi:hypothetical protein